MDYTERDIEQENLAMDLKMEWELKIFREIIDNSECISTDAQDLMDANVKIISECWTNNDSPEETAKLILENY